MPLAAVKRAGVKRAPRRREAARVVAVASGLALVVFAVAGAADDPTGRAAPAASPAAYHLLFTSDRDGDGDVYAVDAHGGRLAALTRNRVDDSIGVVAPSGKFFVYRDGKGFLVSADGRRGRNLGSVFGSDAAVSADGRLLAFNRENTIGIVPVAGGPARNIGSGSPTVFSRDGRFLGFASNLRPGLIDLRTGRRRLLPRPDEDNWTWSPQLTWLAHRPDVVFGDDLVVAGGRSRARPKLDSGASRGAGSTTGTSGSCAGVARTRRSSSSSMSRTAPSAWSRAGTSSLRSGRREATPWRTSAGEARSSSRRSTAMRSGSTSRPLRLPCSRGRGAGAASRSR